MTIRGDVEGLDTLALRGDSLLVAADRAAAVREAMRLSSQEEWQRQFAESLAALRVSPVPPVPPPADSAAAPRASRDPQVASPSAAASVSSTAAVGASVGSAMSRRAQARGDSMARAYAERLTGGKATGASADTVRGVLAWRGDGPARTVVLRAAEGAIALSGIPTMGLGRLVGSDVVIRGVRVSPRDMVVANFVVRAANGVPAYDGVIEADGALRLTDGSGTRRVPLPTAFEGLRGARVWIAPKDGEPIAYGLIQMR